MKPAGLGSLGLRDVIHTFAMFVIGTFTSLVLDSVTQAVASHTYSVSAIHWNYIGFALLTACLTYVQKQLGCNSQNQLLTEEPVLPKTEHSTVNQVSVTETSKTT